MKVEWVNDKWSASRDLEAFVIRGFWRWKRVAHVARATGESWRYLPSGDTVDSKLGDWLDSQQWKSRSRELRKANKMIEDRNWNGADKRAELPRATARQR